MGERGPKPKPALSVVREGNPGHRKPRKAVNPPPGTPKEPDWAALEPAGEHSEDQAARVRTRAREVWRVTTAQLAPLGQLALADETAIRDFALTAARLEEVERQAAMVDWIADPPYRLWTRAAALRSAIRPMYGILGVAPGCRLEVKGSGGPENGDSVWNG